MPPGPVSVTSRFSAIASAAASSSSTRPTNDVSAQRQVAANLRAGQVEPWVVAEDCTFQLAQFDGRIDADLVGEVSTMPVERPQRLDLPAGAVQGQHPGGREPLAQRVGVDQFGELTDHLTVAARGKLGLET